MDAFPHLNINVKDESIYTPITEENLPLHRPIYAMKTEKGPINKPVWCANMAAAEAIFGKKTFNPFDSEYFSRSSVFLRYSFPHNGAFIVRIDADNMAAAAVVLTVTIPTDNTGSYSYNLVPAEAAPNGRYWNDEHIWNDSFLWNASSPGYSPRTFPLAIVNMTDPGAYGNAYGFQLFSDRTKANSQETERLNNHVYSFAFVKQDEGFDTVSRVQTRYPVYQFQFVTETEKRDSATNLYMNYDAAEDRYFGKDYPAPANVHMFEDNWKKLTDDVVTKYFANSSAEVKLAMNATTLAEALTNSRRINVTNMTVFDSEDNELQIGGTTTTAITSIDNAGSSAQLMSIDNSGPSTTFDSVTELLPGNFAQFNVADASLLTIGDLIQVSGTAGTYDADVITITSIQGTVVITDATFVSTETGTVEVFKASVLVLDDATGVVIGDELELSDSIDHDGTHTVLGVVGDRVTVDTVFDGTTDTGTLHLPSVMTDAIVNVVDTTNFAIGDIISIANSDITNYNTSAMITDINGTAFTTNMPFVGVGVGATAICQTIDNDLMASVDLTGAQLNAIADQMLRVGSPGSDGLLNISGEAAPEDRKLDNNVYIESRIERFFNLQVLPQVVDKAHYPFNTIVDTGYSQGLKDTIVDFIAIRDDVCLLMSTWSGAGDTDQATTLGVGKALIENIRQTPESELFGTGTFRATIFGQVGKLNSDVWKDDIPLTLWYTTKLAELHNLSYIKDQPAGLPNAAVEIFKSISWTPASKRIKRDLWTDCINYAQHYDMNHLHFPGLKSVYTHDTSVLATDSYKNTVIYIKQLSLPIWAKYAGTEDVNIAAVYNQVLSDFDAKLAHVLHDKYQFQTRMYQTEEEAKYGYIHHLEIILIGGVSQRVWNLDIICRRPNFGPTT